MAAITYYIVGTGELPGQGRAGHRLAVERREHGRRRHSGGGARGLVVAAPPALPGVRRDLMRAPPIAQTREHACAGPGDWRAVLGAIAFSGKAIIVKLAYRYGVDAVTLIMYRMLFALPIFALMAWWASRGKPPLTRRDWLGVVGPGLHRLLPVELSRLRGAAIHHRLARAADPVPQSHAGAAAGLAAVPAGASGACNCAGHGHQLLRRAAGVRATRCSCEGGQAALGALLVFASAVTYALYLVYSGELVQRLGSLRLVGLATSVACLCCLLQFVAAAPARAALQVAPAGDLAVAAQCHAVHGGAGAAGDDGDRAHRRRPWRRRPAWWGRCPPSSWAC